MGLLDSITGDGLIGGAISGLGGILANQATDARQEKAQQFNAEQARVMMDFQERMSNSAYQRSMADMKAAGLNPILAYQKGGASSPSGAMASTSYTPATDVLSPAVSSAQHGSRLSAEVANMKETNANLVASRDLIKAQTLQAGSQISNINADTQLKAAALGSALRESEKGSQDEQFYKTKTGSWSRWIGNIAGELGRVFGGGAAPMSKITVNPHQGGY